MAINCYVHEGCTFIYVIIIIILLAILSYVMYK